MRDPQGPLTHGTAGEVGADHPAVTSLLNRLGPIHEALGDQEQGLHDFQQSLPGREAAFGKDHPIVVVQLSRSG